MDDPKIEAVLRDYIVTCILHEDDPGLDEETPLLEWGVLNSLEVLRMVDFLESEFEIRIEAEDLRPDNLASIARLAALVRSRMQSP